MNEHNIPRCGVSLKVATFVAAFLLLFNDISFALAPAPGTQSPSVKCEYEIMSLINSGRLSFAEDGDNEHLLKANNGASAVLLSHGKILADKSLKNEPQKLLRALIREEVKAILQIMSREERLKYSKVVNMVMSRPHIRDNYYRLSAEERMPAPSEETLANDIMTKAFDLMILRSNGLIDERMITANESDFLKSIAPIIDSNRGSCFTGVFWDARIRRIKIDIATANGMKFYRVAGLRPGTPDMPASCPGTKTVSPSESRREFIRSRLTPDQFSIVDDNRNHAANNILKVLARGRLPDTFPYQIQLDLTRFCPKWELIQRTCSGPRDCIRCAFPEKSRDEVSHDRLINILRTFESHGGRSVFITGGGEPGAYSKWHELFEFFAGSSLGLTMNTNGHFVRRMAAENADILRKVFSYEKDPSILSISVHDDDAYSAAMQLNDLRTRMGLNIVIRASFMIHFDTTKDEIFEFLRKIQTSGVDMVAFKPTHILRGDELIFNANQSAHDIVKQLTDQQANINAGYPEMGHGYQMFVQAMRLNRLTDAFEDVRRTFKEWQDDGSDPICLGPLCNLYLNSFFQMGMCCDTKDAGIGGMPAEVFGNALPDNPQDYFVEAMWGMIKLDPHHCIVGCGFMEPNLTFPSRFGLDRLITDLKALRTEYRRGALTEGEAKIRLRALFKSNDSQEVARAAATTAVQSAWEHIKGGIEHFDPSVAEKREAFLSRFYNAMERSVSIMKGRASQGRMDPFVKLRTMAFSSDIGTDLHDTGRELRVGFLAQAGNPLNWGHILISFMGMNEWDLDTVIFRVQGEIGYKKLLASERVSVKDRHLMVREAIKGLYPLIRYTDLGSEENNDLQGEEDAMRFLDMNADRKIHLYFMNGIESEERVWRCMRWQYDNLMKYSYGKNPGHKITFAAIRRGEYGARATLEELQRISAAVQKEKGCPVFLDVAFAKDPDIDLNFSSTYYRNTQDGAYVPKVVHDFAKDHGYYGHPPIDPRTGRPVLASQEEYFRKRLEPISDKIAGQVTQALDRGIPGNTALVSIDGGSGSGKTTIAEEVGRFLKKSGRDSVVIPLDIFLRDRLWRLAIQKLVTGRKLTKQEEGMVGDAAKEMKPGVPYLGEEGFFRHEAILKLLNEINEFRRSGRDELVLPIPDAYDQDTKTVGFKKITIRKGMVILFEGKYANEEDLQPYYDLRYRLHDDPDRTKARFEIRSRRQSPADADMQIIFYEMSLVPSYEEYDARTLESINGFIDLRGEEWFLETPDMRRIDITLPKDDTQEQSTFTGSLKGIDAVTWREFGSQAASAAAKAASYESQGQSLILFADDMLESTIVVDLENTVKNILAGHGVLTGGKIVIYARKEANGSLLEKLIKHAGPTLETVRISAPDINTGGDEAREIDALVRTARAKGAKDFLGVIKGPTGRPDELASLAGSLGLPIVIVGPEEGIYSFAQAITIAMEAKIHNGATSGWLIMLPPIRSLTDHIRQQYEEYQRSLQALIAA